MQASADLWLFFALVFGVIAIPGMDMAFVAGSTLTSGLRGGLAAVAGITAAGMLHVAVGATGVATLLLLWPAAFNALLVAGALYMAWIGWSILRWGGGGDAPQPGASMPARAQAAIFRRAALTCLMNPKAYAFMLAVFPAFMHSAQLPLAVRAVQLGGIIAATQLAVYGAVALFVASARQWAGGGPRTRRWSAHLVGATLMAGAVLTLVFAWRDVPSPSMAQPRPLLLGDVLSHKELHHGP